MNAQECYEKGGEFHSKGQHAKAQEYLQMALQLAHKELPKLTSPRAVEYLAEKAYEFFEQEFNASKDIRGIIKNYSEYLLNYHMAHLHYRDTKNEVISNVLKPLHIYYDKLGKWIFDTLQDSMRKNFPNKFYVIRLANSLYDDTPEDSKEFHNAICNHLSHKFYSGFLIDLYLLIKENYEEPFQRNFPSEYNYCLTANSDGLDELWHELYNRAVKLVVDCLKDMGLIISDKEVEKITNNYSYNIGQMVNVKNTVQGGSTVYGGIHTQVGKNNTIKVNDIIPTQTDFNNLIAEIKQSALDKNIADKLTGLLEEVKQAIETKDTVKQTETKQKFSGFWLAVGNMVKGVLQSSAHLTTVLKYLGIG